MTTARFAVCVVVHASKFTDHPKMRVWWDLTINILPPPLPLFYQEVSAISKLHPFTIFITLCQREIPRETPFQNPPLHYMEASIVSGESMKAIVEYGIREYHTRDLEPKDDDSGKKKCIIC